MEHDQGGAGVDRAASCIRQLSAIPSSLAVCHWSRSSEILSRRLGGEVLEEVERGPGSGSLDPVLNRVAVGGRSLLQLSTVEFSRISSFYSISRTNLVDIGWSRSSHALLGLNLSGSANMYVGLKGRHWQMSSRFRSHNIAGCCLEWLGDSPNLFALGFQDGGIKVVNGETLRECSGINISSSEEHCAPVWSACVVPSPVRDMQSRHLGSGDMWTNNELLLVNDDGTISHLDLRAKISQCSRAQTLSRGLSSIRWNPHDSNLFSTGCRQGVQVWDIRRMDGVSVVASIKSPFVVGKTRWRPGFPTQIAFCCSAIDPTIYVYDLLDPNRAIRRFSRHLDVVRDFDWLESDAIISCGADKRLILSVWEDGSRPPGRVRTTSGIYVPTGSGDSSQRVVFNISHESFRATSSRLDRFCERISEDSFEGVVQDAETSDSEQEGRERDFKAEVRRQLDASGSIFRFCSEQSDLFGCSLYSVAGFLPDVGLVPFPGDLGAILDPRCDVSRRLHIHGLGGGGSDWMMVLRRAGVFGLAPSWSSVFSLGGSRRTSRWRDKWGSRVVVHRSKTVAELNQVVFVSPGRGEDPGSLLFSPESVRMLDSRERVECVWDFFQEAFGVEVLQEQRYRRVTQGGGGSAEVLDAVLEELSAQSGLNNVVVCLLIVRNLLPCLAPPDSQILRTSLRLELKWTLGLVALLRKLGLFVLSSQVIKSCQAREIRDLGRESVSESSFYCGSIQRHAGSDPACSQTSYCNRRLGPEKISRDRDFRPRADLHSCTKCRASKNICVVCGEPVVGLWTGCPSCRHGGHIKHMKAWFLSNSVCPSGCGHQCVC
ncbi:WD40 repeat-containing protein [Cryptosporidium canis]|uniref:WD40 repeat-containing protein n=1 Tax=Cryptosporidium canis TaxID=195482 RepID=A0ABQ8P2T9_9CRYT|nr:WD40 repeat-containing protein [Cryptosporidium canis]